MNITRRDLLKAAAIGTAAAVTGVSLSIVPSKPSGNDFNADFDMDLIAKQFLKGFEESRIISRSAIQKTIGA